MGASIVSTDVAVPASGNILGATLTSGTSATLITIPAGRTWNGSLAVECASAQAAASSLIASAGTGVAPAAGTILRVDTVSATTSGASANSNRIDKVFVSAPAGNPVTLTTTIVGTGSASALGVLL